jgi:HTH-type transcriptional regulator/antitoxin HigA
MLAQGAFHVIHSDSELARYTSQLMRLTSIEDPSDAEIDAIELLSVLIEKYENEHYPIPAATPAEVVRFILDQNNLKQRDLVPIFGSEAQVSMFLSGKRALTVNQIQALSRRFGISADVLL